MRFEPHNRAVHNHGARSSKAWQLYWGIIYGSILVTPVLASLFDRSLIPAFLAVALFDICLYPTAHYFAKKEAGIPTLAILCLAYAIQFAVPFFTSEPTVLLAGNNIKYIDDVDVTAALMLSLLGVIVLQIGYYKVSTSKFIRMMPNVNLHLHEKKAAVYCAVVSVVLLMIGNTESLIPEQFRAQFSSILGVFQNQAFVVIGILGWLVYSGRGRKWHKVWLYCIVALMSLRGVSNGMVEQAAVPVAVLLITRWMYINRVPFLALSAMLLVILFLSPVKGEFRERLYAGDVPDTSVQSRVLVWGEQASEYWGSVLSNDRNVYESATTATRRTDFIHQLAHICSLTPSVIPYQYGATYSYFAVTLIPRFLWPEKPEAGSANNFFAVTYGLTTEEGLKKVTFGMSLLGEGYINLGWPGVFMIMLLQGAMISTLQRIFGDVHAGPGGRAIFLAFFVFFLNGIGSSAEILFGNVLQSLLFSCALLWWARRRHTAKESLTRTHHQASAPAGS